MASSTSGTNTRLGVVVVLVSFIAGCWMGMGTDETGDVYCVVTGASVAVRPGLVPGQLAEPIVSDDEDEDDDDSCEAGETQVCGTFEGEDDDRRFESEECP
jgi:hypothetical protein